MQDAKQVICDGCGLGASQEHIARRLKRLEKMTRYRPIHVHALILGTRSPELDEAHLGERRTKRGGDAGGLSAQRNFGYARA